ncbi:MAG: TetR/AcrR family transcriptional regulator [Anaerolineales bacterium]
MTAKKQGYHHGDLRPKLLQVAILLIEEKGSDALTMRELARRCGVSRTAPYRHFSDKAALLAAVAEEGFRRLEEEIRKARIDNQRDASRAVRRCFLAYTAFAADHPTHYRLMFGRGIKRLFIYPGLAAAAKQAFAELMAVVKLGQATGRLPAGRTVRLAYSFWAMSHGLSLLIIDGFADRAGDVRGLSEFACRLLLARSPAETDPSASADGRAG